MRRALRRRALAISMRRTWPDGAKRATGTPRPSAKNGKLLTPFAREHCKLTTATSPRWGAIEWLRRSAAAAPGAEPFTYLLLASAYALNGRQAEAQPCSEPQLHGGLRGPVPRKQLSRST